MEFVCMNAINFFKNGKATLFSFPSASSHQILYYLDVHLEGRQINTVIMRAGTQDILKNSK